MQFVSTFRRIRRLPRSHWHPCPESHGRAQPLQSEAPYAQNAGKGTIWSISAAVMHTVYGVPRPLSFPIPKTDQSSAECGVRNGQRPNPSGSGRAGLLLFDIVDLFAPPA